MRNPGLIILALLAGCTHMHVVCQDAGTTSLAVGGNTAGQQILSLGLAIGGAAAKGGGLMAPTPSTAPGPTAQSQSYIDYNYLAMFGADYAGCTTYPPSLPPSTSVVFLPPGGGPPQIITTDSHQVVVAPPGPTPAPSPIAQLEPTLPMRVVRDR